MHIPAKNSLAGRFFTVAVAAAPLFTACSEAPDEVSVASGDVAALLPAHEPATTRCGPAGRLQTELYGALEGPIDWSGDALACEGMPRPAGRGARLRFAGSVAGIELAFVIALPDLEAGRTASELPAKVTLIEEGDGRFFSTSDTDSCWADLGENEIASGDASRYRVAGTLYCIAPLAEVNGVASVTMEEAAFSGYVDWDAE